MLVFSTDADEGPDSDVPAAAVAENEDEDETVEASIVDGRIDEEVVSSFDILIWVAVAIGFLVTSTESDLEFEDF